MNFVLSLKEFLQLTRNFRLMLFALFFMKIGQFMLLPFLAIYLSKYSYISPSMIGITVGIGPFIYAVICVIAGVSVDRFGVKTVMIFSLFFGGLAIFFFFYGNNIRWFFLMNALTGASRAFFDISSKTYGISKLSIEQRKTCFSLRFMVSNSAAAIGPVIGAYFASHDSFLLFKITGALYFLLGILSVFFLKTTNNQKRLDTSNKIGIFREVVHILSHDRAVRMLLLISTIIWIVYSQIDSTLPQYLYAKLNNGVRIYSLLLVTNAVICVVLQLIVSTMTKNLNEYMLSMFSMFIFAISYIVIALFLSESALMVAIIILTLAEITIIPLNDLLLLRIAPPERIGTYYGILGLAMLGLGVGPMLGGYLYEYFTAKILFLICSVSCLLMLFLYRKLFYEIVRE